MFYKRVKIIKKKLLSLSFVYLIVFFIPFNKNLYTSSYLIDFGGLETN